MRIAEQLRTNRSRGGGSGGGSHSCVGSCADPELVGARSVASLPVSPLPPSGADVSKADVHSDRAQVTTRPATDWLRLGESPIVPTVRSQGRISSDELEQFQAVAEWDEAKAKVLKEEEKEEEEWAAARTRTTARVSQEGADDVNVEGRRDPRLLPSPPEVVESAEAVVATEAWAEAAANDAMAEAEARLAAATEEARSYAELLAAEEAEAFARAEAEADASQTPYRPFHPPQSQARPSNEAPLSPRWSARPFAGGLSSIHPLAEQEAVAAERSPSSELKMGYDYDAVAHVMSAALARQPLGTLDTDARATGDAMAEAVPEPPSTLSLRPMAQLTAERTESMLGTRPTPSTLGRTFASSAHRPGAAEDTPRRAQPTPPYGGASGGQGVKKDTLAGGGGALSIGPDGTAAASASSKMSLAERQRHAERLHAERKQASMRAAAAQSARSGMFR